MPAANLAPLIAIEVDDGQEVRRHGPLLCLHREVLLVVAHDGNQNLIRQGEEFLPKPAPQHGGAFGLVDNQVEQFLVLSSLEGRAPKPMGDFLHNLFAALLRVHQHERTAQLRPVVRGAPDGNAPVGQ